MSKTNQWVAWVVVTGALLWFLMKPKRAHATPTPGPGSSFAVPQTGAAITSAGAQQAANRANPISGSPLGSIPGLGSILSGLQNLFKGGGGSKVSVGASGGGGGDKNEHKGSQLPDKPDYSANQRNPPYSDESGKYVPEPEVTSVPWDGPSFDPYADTSGTYDPSAVESPWTDPGTLDTSVNDPGGELQPSPDLMPIAEDPDPGFGGYFDQPSDSVDNFDTYA